MRFLGWMEEGQPAVTASIEAASIETAARLSAVSGRAGPGVATPGPCGALLRAVRAAASERLCHPGTLSAAAGEEILQWNLVRGADPAVEPSWRSLLRGDGVAVVTGQQPAFLGGPLYTLYKLLSTVELAAELERSLGCPALAVFWVVGDDADFGEVSSTWLPGPDGSVRRLRDDAIPPGGTMIGMLPASRQLAALDAALSTGPPMAGGADAKGDVRNLGLGGVAAVGGDWSGFLAALVFRLLPGVPCLFVDGAHPAVVREQTPWIREVVRGWPLRDLLREGEIEARAAGFEPALEPALGERAAFRLAGGQREPWTGESEDALTLGPNVVLRPLLQDLLLPNAATVCGPSEVRYRAQLGPLYRHAGVPRPPLVPRLRAVLLPPGGPNPATEDHSSISAGCPGAGQVPPPEAFHDPDAYLARRTEDSAPADLLARIDALRLHTREDLAALGTRLAVYDAGLQQIVDSAAGKADFQLQRIREGFLVRVRQRLLRNDSRLARWREFVTPRDGEQERSLSLLAPFLLGGPGAMGELRAVARGHLRRLDEGRSVATAVLDLATRESGGRSE